MLTGRKSWQSTPTLNARPPGSRAADAAELWICYALKFHPKQKPRQSVENIGMAEKVQHII